MPNKQQIARSFGRRAESYDAHAVEQRRIARTLTDLMQQPRAARVLEIGCGTGFVTSVLAELYGAEHLTINDLSSEMCLGTAARLGIEQTIVGDAETVDLPREMDLIVSASTFQWFAALGATLHRLADSLNKGGTLAFSTFGPRNLHEVRSITGRGLHYPTREEIETLLSRDYTTERTTRTEDTLWFGSALEVAQHLHLTGVCANTSAPLSRKGLTDFCTRYEAEYKAADGRVGLTYEALYFVCRKR